LAGDVGVERGADDVESRETLFKFPDAGAAAGPTHDAAVGSEEHLLADDGDGANAAERNDVGGKLRDDGVVGGFAAGRVGREVTDAVLAAGPDATVGRRREGVHHRDRRREVTPADAVEFDDALLAADVDETAGRGDEAVDLRVAAILGGAEIAEDRAAGFVEGGGRGGGFGGAGEGREDSEGGEGEENGADARGEEAKRKHAEDERRRGEGRQPCWTALRGRA